MLTHTRTQDASSLINPVVVRAWNTRCQLYSTESVRSRVPNFQSKGHLYQTGKPRLNTGASQVQQDPPENEFFSWERGASDPPKCSGGPCPHEAPAQIGRSALPAEVGSGRTEVGSLQNFFSSSAPSSDQGDRYRLNLRIAGIQHRFGFSRTHDNANLLLFVCTCKSYFSTCENFQLTFVNLTSASSRRARQTRVDLDTQADLVHSVHRMQRQNCTHRRRRQVGNDSAGASAHQPEQVPNPDRAQTSSAYPCFWQHVQCQTNHRTRLSLHQYIGPEFAVKLGKTIWPNRHRG